VIAIGATCSQAVESGEFTLSELKKIYKKLEEKTKIWM
jgi:hypothetical protein